MMARLFAVLKACVFAGFHFPGNPQSTALTPAPAAAIVILCGEPAAQRPPAESFAVQMTR
jgi:hypothetical protein